MTSWSLQFSVIREFLRRTSYLSPVFFTFNVTVWFQLFFNIINIGIVESFYSIENDVLFFLLRSSLVFIARDSFYNRTCLSFFMSRNNDARFQTQLIVKIELKRERDSSIFFVFLQKAREYQD